MIQNHPLTLQKTHKNKPPLDTFRAGIAFHISPPRFIDVVRRRLELGIEYLNANAPNRQEFLLENGARIVLPTGELGNFLRALYSLIFAARTNISRLLEAISGRDVRKALEMFVSIVTSGHLSTSAITSTVRGEGAIPIHERHIIRILMRTDYRFFSDNNTNVSNIFDYSNDWKRPDNFLLSEILYFLSLNRKRRGEIGLEGYFSVSRVCDEIQRVGYDKDDVFRAINYLLHRHLITADNFNFSAAELSHSVKILPSGFMHLRVLCERMEYLVGVMPVTPIANKEIAEKLASFVNSESQRGSLITDERVKVVRTMLNFFKYELFRLREQNPFFDPARSGAVYVLNAMDRALQRFTERNVGEEGKQNELDLE